MLSVETPMANHRRGEVIKSLLRRQGGAELPGGMKIFTDVDEKHLSNEKTLVNFCIEGVILPS